MPYTSGFQSPLELVVDPEHAKKDYRTPGCWYALELSQHMQIVHSSLIEGLLMARTDH